MLLIKNEIEINSIKIANTTIQETIEGFFISKRYQMRYSEGSKFILIAKIYRLIHHNSKLTPFQLFCFYKVVLNCLGFLKTWLVMFSNRPE